MAGRIPLGNGEGLVFLTSVALLVLHVLDDGFSAIVLLSVQGFLLHRLVVVARRRFVFWQAESGSPR